MNIFSVLLPNPTEKIGGGFEGMPRPPGILSITSGGFIAQRILLVPLQRSHIKASTAHGNPLINDFS
jgi:hypothetical protein